MKYDILPSTWPGLARLFILGGTGIGTYILALLILWYLNGKKADDIEAKIVGKCLSKFRKIQPQS